MPATLETLGFDDFFRDSLEAWGRGAYAPGRIVEGHLEKYTVSGANVTYHAEIAGSLRHELEARADFPTAGDWVALRVLEGQRAIVHHVLPRRSALMRQATSGRVEKQVIGANIDIALILQAAESDFNLNRLDRYVAAAHGGGIRPVVLLSKIDLITPDALARRLAAIAERHPDVEHLCLSSVSGEGLDQLCGYVEPGKTYCLLGSSGVGKSTLVNMLLQEELLVTRAISDWNRRGKHSTTHRALFVLPSGAIFIDTPGMRELAVAEGEAGLERTFGDIYELAASCRFSDCRHEEEPGCAVRQALESGALDVSKYDNYCKMKREAAFFATSAAEKRRNAKSQGKLYRRIKRENAERRY